MKIRIPKAYFMLLLLGILPVAAIAEEADFDSNGVKIHYRITGEGEPVLLIHGFGLNGLMQWTKLRSALKDDYRLIAIDNRGHGKSDKPRDPEKYGIEMVRDQVRLLDHLGIEKAHIVGYSMGGGIALRLVATHPERVQTAVIGGMGWREPNPEENDIPNPLIEDLENERGFGHLFQRLAATDATEEEKASMRTLGNILTAMNDQKALAAMLKHRRDDQLTAEDVRAIRLPMTAIIGETDPILPAAEKLKELNPETKLIVVPRASHQTAMGAPEFIAGVRELLEAHPLPAPGS